MFGEAVNNYQNGVRTIGVRKRFYEVHGDGIPWTQRNWKLLEYAIGFVELRLESHTRHTGLAVILDIVLETGSIEVTSNKT